MPKHIVIGVVISTPLSAESYWFLLEGCYQSPIESVR